MEKLKDYKLNFPLTEEKMDYSIGEVETRLRGCDIDNKTIVAVGLMIESELLGWNEYFSDKKDIHEFEIRLYSFMGRNHIKLSLKEDRYYPDKNDENSFPFLQNIMYSNINDYGINMNRSYSKGANILDITLPRKKLSPVIKNLIAVLLAVVTYLGTMLLPENVVKALCDNIISPAFSTMLGLLTMTAMVLIFFSIISSIVNMGEISMLSKYAGKTIKKYLSWMLVALSLLAVIVIPLTGILSVSGDADYSAFADIYKMILDIVPKNIVTPFADGNALQISFLAVCIGILLLINKSKSDNLVNVVNEASDLFFQAINIVCKIAPVIVYLSVSKMLLSGMLMGLLSSWKIVAIAVAVDIILCASITIFTFLKTKVPVKSIIKDVFPIYLIGFTTSSSYACSERMFSYAKKHRVSSKELDFLFPMGQIFFKPDMLATLVIIPLCLCEVYGISVSIPQLITFLVSAFLLSISCPAVAGGAAAALTVLLGMLGIGAEGIAIALAIDVILDMLGTGTKVYSFSNIFMMNGYKKDNSKESRS